MSYQKWRFLFSVRNKWIMQHIKLQMSHTILVFNKNHTYRICKNSCICRAQHCNVSINTEYFYVWIHMSKVCQQIKIASYLIWCILMKSGSSRTDSTHISEAKWTEEMNEWMIQSCTSELIVKTSHFFLILWHLGYFSIFSSLWFVVISLLILNK